VAKECAEWSLPEKQYFEFFDQLMADSLKEPIADSAKLSGNEKAIVEIYQQGTRDFLAQNKALEKTWDKAARKLMLEFSEKELLLVRDYQDKKVGRGFLHTKTGKKWRERAEPIIQSAVDEVRQSLDPKYESYRKTIQERIESYSAQGKIPADLVRPGAPELKPIDSDTPLFEIFEGIPLNPDKPSFKVNFSKPLLVVSTLSDLRLEEDGKGVVLRLNPKDTYTFTKLEIEYKGRILFWRGADNVMEGMRIVEPVGDGYIRFTHQRSAAMAEYVRKRFRIGEFR
jgi:hypothetical protein